MSSTFPTTKSSSQNIKNGIKEIKHKKETLLALEIALKKRINEFRELCLKEGELTGHLPVDYPLQPREPIPQVRRRMTRSNGNIPSELITSNNILQAALRSQSIRLTPSSTSSTISAEESAKARLQSVEEPTVLRVNTISTVEEPNKVFNLNGATKFQPYYEETKPFQMSDFYKYSSKIRQQTTNGNSDDHMNNNQTTDRKYETDLIKIHNGADITNHQQQPPMRPPRLNNVNTIRESPQKHRLERQLPKLPAAPPLPTHQHQLNPNKFTTICDLAIGREESRPKTTRQLQEEISRGHHHIKMVSCDDQILASRKLIEKSGQKLIEATAKAIAGNPSLAERLNTLLPQHNGSGQRY